MPRLGHRLCKRLGLSEAAAVFRKGRVGRRFREYYLYRRSRSREWAVMHWSMVSLGILLILMGAVLGPVPIIPGFLMIIPGVAILCSRSLIAARVLDFLDRQFLLLRHRLIRLGQNRKRGAARAPTGRSGGTRGGS